MRIIPKIQADSGLLLYSLMGWLGLSASCFITLLLSFVSPKLSKALIWFCALMLIAVTVVSIMSGSFGLRNLILAIFIPVFSMLLTYKIANSEGSLLNKKPKSE